MSCNCSKPIPAPAPSVESLPTISTCDAPHCDKSCESPITGAHLQGSPISTCPDPSSIRSSASCGFTLPQQWTDSVVADEDVVLLGRWGRKLSRFTGSGFLQLVKGKAKLVQSVRLKISTLWHEWWKPPGINKNPVLGNPIPVSHLVVSEDGEPHLWAGRTDEDSLPIFNKETNKWEVRPASEVPHCAKGHLPGENAVELVGFKPIPANGSIEDVRCLSRLSGSGIIVVNQAPSVASGCACGGCQAAPGVSSIATFLPNPDGPGTFTLKYSADSGHYWEED